MSYISKIQDSPTSSELLLETVTVKSEPCSSEMEQSSIEETHATQFENQTNAVYYSREIFPIEENPWKTFQPTIISKETLFKPKSQNWS